MSDEPHSHEPNRDRTTPDGTTPDRTTLDRTTTDQRARVRSVRYAVPGMTRRDDEAHLRDHLQRIDGVTSITVDAPTRTVDVRYDPDRVSEETVRGAIADAGYAVERDRTDDSAGADERARSRNRERGDGRGRAGKNRGRPSRSGPTHRDGCDCRCCRRSRKNDVRGGSSGRSR